MSCCLMPYICAVDYAAFQLRYVTPGIRVIFMLLRYTLLYADTLQRADSEERGLLMLSAQRCRYALPP